ncbi:MAG TPA: DUF4019 domain-containing protein [Pelovirga sp.]|nr:DUF4019 domain-containing protein [Pelovirga sp.]
MKKLTSITLIGIYTLLTVTIGYSSDLLSADAVAAAERFAQVIDNGNSRAAYSQASPLLRQSQNEQEFVTTIERAQLLLGPVQQRQLTALRSIGIYPRFPDGDYLIVQFEARTQHKNKAAEVILLRHQDGVWLVADYSIR